ncbi:CPBP family glutamic-type intramembrane protease [Desulfogranum japonicum]|uniref:CPBP family glutamic-type intramembrane protease n=1 Tax=Desulfogranum japonicum TaxID=231447 RepID=UPI0004066A29|nr:CPBP family glutamic-type intramembrane protease [Desulfogranum japonicum]
MIENCRLLLPYVAPYFSYVCVASLLHDALPVELNYVLRIILASGFLYWAWDWYIPLHETGKKTTSVLFGLAYGTVGCALWILLLSPFVSPENTPPWSNISIIIRIAAAGFLVPVFEELMVRGYAFRLALQWDTCRKEKVTDPLYTTLHERSINDVAPEAWSWPAVCISTAVFTIGHAIPEWPAAVAYGLLMCHLMIQRKNLLSCIIAHATTNILLAGYVYLTGSYHLW